MATVIQEDVRAPIRRSTSQRLWWFAIPLLGTLLAAYALRVPHGLPYDEDSHWLNVLFVASHGRMPNIGEPGSTYEAQMGPIAYYVDAAVLLVARGLGMTEGAAFQVVRLSGALWLAALALLLSRVVQRVQPSRGPGFAVIGAILVSFSPILAAIGMSVQNDIPALVLAVGALHLTITARGRTWEWAAVGAVFGIAILTKFTVWPAFVVSVCWLTGQRRLRSAMTVSAAAAGVSGWWFLRNVALYGDPTGVRAVVAAGYDWPPQDWLGLASVERYARAAATFLTLPTEYFRNLLQAPVGIELCIAGVMVAGCTGAVLASRRMTRELLLITGTAAVSVASWLAADLLVHAASFRIAYLCLPLWAVGIAAVCRSRVVAVVVTIAVCAMHAWVLVSLGAVQWPLG